MKRDSHAARKRRNQIKARQIRFRKKNVPKELKYGDPGTHSFILNPLNGRYECPLCHKTQEEIFGYNKRMTEADLQKMLANMY
jgi:hypothetical protein